MRRLRPIIAMLLGIGVVGALGASAAIALPMEWLLEGKAIPAPEQLPVLRMLLTGDWILLAEPLGIKLEILCSKAEILGGWIGEVRKALLTELAFITCFVIKPEKCEVFQPIEVSISGELLEELPWILFTPAGGGKVFVEIELTSCLVAGKYKVEGDQECQIEKGEEELKLHELTCDELRSLLTMGGLPAGVEITLPLELESELPFSVA